MFHLLTSLWEKIIVCISCLGEEVRTGSCSGVHSFPPPLGLPSWGVRPLSRGMSWAIRFELAMTLRLFSHKTACRKKSVLILCCCLVRTSLSVSLYLNIMAFGANVSLICYYTEYRWTAVNLCCKSRALSKFLFWLDHSPSSRGDGVFALNFCIGFNGNLLQGSCEYGSVSLLIA